ncbi:MAG: hypothetical protein HOD17_09340, partial [Desulfobacteraceae bacterium]|nr:hypothetical protein [Desulfobacteraceae bacterium]
MTTSEVTEKKPLWLLIEENILDLDSQDLSEGNLEASIKKVAGKLDSEGYNVSKNGGNLLQLRWAMNETQKVGRPFMKDLNTAIEALTLDDVADPYSVTNKLILDIGETWPILKKSENRPDVIQIVEKTKLDLLIVKAKDLSGDEGIRLLIEEEVASEVITSALDITAEKLEQVNTEMEKELAEKERVTTLLEAVEGKTDEEKVKHLIENNVADNLIVDIGKVDQNVINVVKESMEAELKEKQRLEEEEAALKAAKKAEEAAGPQLEDISPEDMIDYIDSIREIMEFSEEEKEIRVMCEQSSIPISLVDIAVSEPDKLDELE